MLHHLASHHGIYQSHSSVSAAFPSVVKNAPPDLTLENVKCPAGVLFTEIHYSANLKLNDK